MEKLKQWLDMTHVSVAELAEELECSRQTVYNRIEGRSDPSGLLLRRLHQRTRIPLDDLVPNDNP